MKTKYYTKIYHLLSSYLNTDISDIIFDMIYDGNKVYAVHCINIDSCYNCGILGVYKNYEDAVECIIDSLDYDEFPIPCYEQYNNLDDIRKEVIEEGEIDLGDIYSIDRYKLIF